MITTKHDFVKRMVEKTGLNYGSAEKVCETFIGVLKDALLEGCEVRLQEIGVFQFRYLEGKVGASNLPALEGKEVVRVPRVRLKFKTFDSMSQLLQLKMNDGKLNPGDL